MKYLKNFKKIIRIALANELIKKEQADNSQSDSEKPDKLIKEESVKNTIIEKGDNVKLSGQSAVGTVLELQGKQATVAFGSIKSNIALNRLVLVSKVKK